MFALKAKTNEIVSRLMSLVTDTETFYERVESVYAHYAKRHLAKRPSVILHRFL